MIAYINVFETKFDNANLFLISDEMRGLAPGGVAAIVLVILGVFAGAGYVSYRQRKG